MGKEATPTPDYIKEWETLNVMRVMGGNKQLYAFTTMHGTGFQLAFPNRVTLSIQFGPENYCENKDGSKWLRVGITDKLKASRFRCLSDTAEVAIIDNDGGKEYFITASIWKKLFPDAFMLKEGDADGVTAVFPDEVQGWVHLGEVVVVINALWNMTREEVNKCIHDFPRSDPSKSGK